MFTSTLVVAGALPVTPETVIGEVTAAPGESGMFTSAVFSKDWPGGTWVAAPRFQIA